MPDFIRKTEKVLFIMAWAALTAASVYLFYRQSVPTGVTGEYAADLITHIVWVVNEEGVIYSLNSLVFYLLYWGFGNTVGIAVFMGLAESATVFVVYRFFLSLDEANGCKTDDDAKMLFRWYTIGFMFIISVVLPFVFPHFYYGNMAMNSWHNDTYITMRLFSVPAFALYIKMCRSYKEGIKLKDWGAHTLLLILSTASKPSFFLAIAPVALVIFIIDFICNIKNFSVIKRIILFGTSFLPAAAIIFYQNKLLYGDDAAQEASIVFDPFTVASINGNPAVKLGILLVFPLIVLGHSFARVRKDAGKYYWYILVWVFWAVEMFYYMFLAEGGDRWHDENFSWGAQFGNYILYMASFYMVKEILKGVIENKKSGKVADRKDVVFVNAAAVFFIYLTAVGGLYFLHVMVGHFPLF